MPENKDKLTEKGLRDELERAFFASDTVYTQVKQIVKEHFGLKNWTCTFKEYYALPEPIRKYIAALETNADPPSMVRENIYFRDTIEALVRKNELLIQTIKPTVTRTEIENAVGDTSDEYLEGVIELFESKGFTVEMGK